MFKERILLSLVFALMMHFILIQIMVENIKKGLIYNESVFEVEYIKPMVANEFNSPDRKEVERDKKKEEITQKDEQKSVEEEEEIVKEEKGQVVYLGETNNKAPEKYKYLSEYNSSVEKETKSRYADNKYKNPAPRPQVGESIAKFINSNKGGKKRVAPDVIIKEQKGEGEDEKDFNQTSRLALKIPKLLKSDNIKLEESESGNTKNSEYSEELDGKDEEFQFGTSQRNGEELHRKRLAKLFPEDIYSGKYSGGPFNDWLKDVEESDSTFLNAREYKYATFFNRIKKSVSQYWNPSDVILKYDPYGNIYGNKDRLTIVKVKIDSSGILKEVDVSQSSGVEFLDRVAIDAFKAAQPFPNPPKGLMDKNGEITFNFGFYIEFSKSSLRLFKYE